MDKKSVLKKCLFCPKKLTRTTHLKRHMLSVHKRNANGELVGDDKVFVHCKVCDKKYKSSQMLQMHFSQVHSVEPPEQYKCSLCGYKTLNKRSLISHTQRRHKLGEDGTYAPLVFKFQCAYCLARFNKKKNMMYHEKSVHNISPPCLIERKCPLCDFIAVGLKKEEIHQHFEHTHGMEIKEETLEFDSMEDFLEWKKNTEKETTNYFAQTSRANNLKLFRCHRNGFKKPRENIKRRTKLKGSCKINGYCPATMKLKIKPNSFEVVYISTHVGHSNELEHMRLTYEEKELIAEQLADGIPPREVLDNIRSCASDSDLGRISLINEKDIFNIRRQFNIKGTRKKRVSEPESVLDVEITEPEEAAESAADELWTEEVELGDEDNEDVTFEQEKETLRQQLEEMMSELDSKELVRMVRHQIEQITPSIRAMKSSQEQNL